MRYHIRPGTGEPGPCRAQAKCPYGDEANHYPTREDARQAFEASMAENAIPESRQYRPTSILAATAKRVEAIEDIPSLANDLMTELTEGLYCGRTYAREQAASGFPGRGMGGAFLDPDFREGRVDREGQALAYSCWDLADAFATRLHRQGVTASIHMATPAEEGAFTEPHAVVIYQDGRDSPKYLADPYFDMPSIPLDEPGVETYSSPLVESSLENDPQRRMARLMGERPKPRLLSVHHATYPKPYLYHVGEESLKTVELQAALNGAPEYVGSEGKRVMRVRFGDTLARATEKVGSFEVLVWKNGEVAKSEHASWPEAIAAVEQHRLDS